jgi:hypothetical protein
MVIPNRIFAVGACVHDVPFSLRNLLHNELIEEPVWKRLSVVICLFMDHEVVDLPLVKNPLGWVLL